MPIYVNGDAGKDGDWGGDWLYHSYPIPEFFFKKSSYPTQSPKKFPNPLSIRGGDGIGSGRVGRDGHPYLYHTFQLVVKSVHEINEVIVF